MTDGGATASALLEREGELAQLGAALSRARNGNGRVVLVQGPAGIGKTRLLDETRARARAVGLDVLGARGGELESGHGFGIVRQLLEPAVARARRDDDGELLAGAATLASSVFASSASAPGPAAATQPVLHGLYWLVANLAERGPLLLAIDDVQWSDGPSLRFLLYLARRLEGMPVSLALAVRTGEPVTHDELLRSLLLEAHPPVLEPSALSRRATSALTASRLGPDVTEDVARACHDATRGNPFLLVELLHQLRGAAGTTDSAAVGRITSDRIAAATLLRIGHLDRCAPALARAVAVLGDSADLDTAAALAGVDPAAAAELADMLARAEILEAVAPPRPLRFVHPLLRTAVYEDMPRAERARRHAHAAQLVADGPGGADAAAVHLLLSDPAGDERAVELLREAARAALSRGAPETAVELLRRAQREGPPAAVRSALRLQLGSAAARAGQPDGVQLLREAFAQADGQPVRAIAGLELAFALGYSGPQSVEAIPVLEGARDGLVDEELLTLVDASLVAFAICVPATRPRLSEHLRRARAAIDRPPSPPQLALLCVLAIDQMFEGAPAAEIVALAMRTVGVELWRRDLEYESAFAPITALALIYAGELEAARHVADEGIAYSRDRGSRYAVARICGVRSQVLWRLGDLSAAEADARGALSVAAAWGIPHAISTAVLTRVAVERGDPESAQAELDALDPDPALLDVTPNQFVRESRAVLLLAQGRPQEALTVLEDYARWEERVGIKDRLSHLSWRPLAARAHLQLGDDGAAHELAAHELVLARAFGAAPQIGNALRALGAARGADGAGPLGEAVAVLAPSGARLDHAHALVELGTLLRRGRQRSAATDALRAGMELAHRCGATALVQNAAGELRLAGARPRRIALSGRDSLTPGERRVAGLAAQGMSNKEIAQALFVTLRTVEMHLSNGYRKLDISSREQLAQALEAG